MAKMLLVVNGADYSMEAVRKAAWLAQKEVAEMDVVYVHPACVQMYPEIPGLCFWMPEYEYKIRADQLMNRVLNEDIIPALKETGLEMSLITTHRDQDQEIKRMSENTGYDKIFITGHSKFCMPESNRWFSFKHKPDTIPNGTVCLV
ncbi:MAG: universal stress protein [Firmicutes bacterium]|nr:universal stress protein [Bacillota bacterium]